MSQETFPDTLIRLEAFKRIFVFRPKIDVFPKGIFSVLCQNDQSSKSLFFTRLCPKGTRSIEKLLWELFLSANNAVTKNFPLGIIF